MRTATIEAEQPRARELSVDERNQIVVSYLWCIDCVIRQNYALVQAAHLDTEDVYQSLALRLIRAVELYRPGPKSLKGFIFTQLKYELLTCKSAKSRYGFGAAPYDLRGAVISLDALMETETNWENACVTL